MQRKKANAIVQEFVLERGRTKQRTTEIQVLDWYVNKELLVIPKDDTNGKPDWKLTVTFVLYDLSWSLCQVGLQYTVRANSMSIVSTFKISVFSQRKHSITLNSEKLFTLNCKGACSCCADSFLLLFHTFRAPLCDEFFFL